MEEGPHLGPATSGAKGTPPGVLFYTRVMDFPAWGEWSEPWVYRQPSDMLHRYSVASADPILMPELGPIKNMRWTRMGPGGFILPHIDATPYHIRWHFPWEPGGYWWADGEITEPTEPFKAKHWEPHAAWNPTDHERIHLVVDLEEVPTDAPSQSPLIMCDLFPEIAEMLP